MACCYVLDLMDRYNLDMESSGDCRHYLSSIDDTFISYSALFLKCAI